MGVMSRRVVPACSSLCYCCPSLRARSRQPVKRYKKLLSEIFKLSADGEPNDRKISKLCEYASRNPSRIPNITTYLDQRFYKDLRNEQLSLAKVVPCIYRKLLSSCKEQMPLLASSSLTIIEVLLGQRREDFQILGCLMLVEFLDNQVDVAYMVNVEEMIQKLCQFGQVMEDSSVGSNLRAVALQALASLVQYMGELSHISERFDDIVSAMMDNYEAIQEPFENGFGNQGSDFYASERRKVLSTSINDNAKVALSTTLDVRSNPAYWSRVCLHNIAKIAKEATTVRRVIDPLFRIFDERKHWSSGDGIAYSVLHDMQALMEKSGQNSHLLLSIAIKHIDHKNVVKQYASQIGIIKVISHLARQTKVQFTVAIMTAISDTVRHLRSCMRLILEASDQQTSDIRNVCSLYCALEECLVQLSKKVGDVGPIHDMLAVVLENLSPNAIIARASISSVYRTVQIAASIPNLSNANKAFPEALFHQLLIAMMHADNKTRIGSHRVLSAIVSPSLPSPWSVTSLPIPVKDNDPRKICLLASSAFSSWTIKDELNSRSSIFEDLLKSDNDCLQENDYDPKSIQLTSQQVEFLLSSIWMQASLKDNIPANFEAMGHSYNVALLSLQIHGKAMLARCFQLAFSLRNMSLDNENSLQASRRRPLYSLASSMLLFSAKAFGVPEIVSIVKSKVSENMVDPHLCLVEESRLCATDPETSGNEIAYGSEEDDIAASNFLSSVDRNDDHIKEVVSCGLESNLGSSSEEDRLTGTREQLHREFSPDESFPFSAAWCMEADSLCGNVPKDNFDEDEGPSAVEDVESCFEESTCQSEQRASVSLNSTDVPSVNQLLQSVVETAGEEMAKPSVSSGPVPYDQMKSQCEALVVGKEKMSILSTFKHLQEESDDRTTTTTEGSVLTEVHSTEGAWNTEAESSVTSKDHRMQRCDSTSSVGSDHWLRLPPASPFDKFLMAARC